jgi:mRNA interferase MazF
VRRGEIWWADLAPPVRRRPVLLLSRDRAYRVRANITFALVTGTFRGLRTEVPLGLEDGMPEECVVNADDIVTAPKTLLLERITALTPDKLAAVENAVKFALDLR